MGPYRRSRAVTFTACMLGLCMLLLSACAKTPEEAIISRYQVRGSQTVWELFPKGTVLARQPEGEVSGDYSLLDANTLRIDFAAGRKVVRITKITSQGMFVADDTESGTSPSSRQMRRGAASVDGIEGRGGQAGRNVW